MTTVQGPLSPHLQIYKPQLTSVLSITHRATGVFLCLGALLVCYWLMGIAAGPDTYNKIALHINAWYGRFLLLLFTFSFYYHLCNGIRHLFWDIGTGLEIGTTYKTGYAVIICTVLLTVLTCLYGSCL